MAPVKTTGSAVPAAARTLLPRPYLRWLAATRASLLGDAALFFALGWAAAMVLSAITLPRTLFLLLGGAEALRAVRTVTGLSLWRSRQLLDSAPATARSEVPFDAAERAARRLRGAGVPVAVVCGWCRRTVSGGDGPVDPGPCASPYWPAAHCPANSATSCDCGFCAVHGPLPGHTPHGAA